MTKNPDKIIKQTELLTVNPRTSGKEEEDPRFLIRMAEHDLNFKSSDQTKPEILDLAFCLNSGKWGSGECSSILMEHLLLTFSESMQKPKYIVLMDSAVFLATENSVIESLEALQKMEKNGVQILLNETSVQHYQILSGILVGKVVKFMEIARVMTSVERFINF